MKPYLSTLNEVQRKAVLATDGPVLVVAGPGSGKTRVLTYRVAHLIEEGAAPWEILALTFTNKAAREMKERIAKVVGNDVNKVWAGTFHSIFARILRVEADQLGYPTHFTIYDTDDTKSVLTAIIKEMNLNRDHYNVNAIRSRISSAKSNLITPQMYAEDQELTMQDRQANRPQLHEVYAKYTARCKRSGAMDFDDLLYRLYELLQNFPEARKKYQNRFRYILVDEFQDTNHLQYEIVRKLLDYRDEAGEVDTQRSRNVCVVGDDAQSIYAFRGATIENILHFERDFKRFGIRVFKLEQNYRSTDPIVQAANEVITHNRSQIPKKIWSDKGVGQRIKVIRAMADSEEGRRVADIILEQKNRYHLHNSDIAILYRTNAQSRIFEENLRRHNIPYRVFGGLSFYQRKEVKDFLAYLRLAINQQDDEALRRVINYPRRGIGAASVDKLSQHADTSNRTMWGSIDSLSVATRTRKALLDFKAMIQVFARRANEINAYELATFVAKQSGLINLLRKDNSVEGMGRLENVMALLDGIKDFVENDELQVGDSPPEKSLAAYLQSIALLTDFDNKDAMGDFVNLMTVHSAKGLEFRSVIVVGLEEKLFPSFMSMGSREELDEERRLFYVAITRAEQFLTLTYSASRYRFGQMRYNDPSRFLDEVPVQVLEQINPVVNRRAEQQAAGVRGNFRSPLRKATPKRMANPSDFKPSPSHTIQEGMKVLHMRFGEGEVMSIDGGEENRVATIHFQNVDNPQRRIMLKFAKLQILGPLKK